MNIYETTVTVRITAECEENAADILEDFCETANRDSDGPRIYQGYPTKFTSEEMDSE